MICTYKEGLKKKYIFDELEFTKLMYQNECLYNKFGQHFCTMYDIGISKGGSEAVVESVYSVMKSQAMSGGQSNNTLVTRTKVDWHYPKTSLAIPEIIDDATKLLGKTKGDPFTATGARRSKVISHLASDTGRILSTLNI